MCRTHRAAIVWILIATMTFSPTLVYAQPPVIAQQAPAAAKAKIDLGYVTPDTCAAVVLYPRHVLTAANMEMLPVEVLSAAGKKELGIDPVEIEQAMAIAEPPQGGPPAAAVVLRMATPLGQGKILGPLWDKTADGQLNGKTYRQAKGPMDFSIFQSDDRTLLVLRMAKV